MRSAPWLGEIIERAATPAAPISIAPDMVATATASPASKVTTSGSSPCGGQVAALLARYRSRRSPSCTRNTPIFTGSAEAEGRPAPQRAKDRSTRTVHTSLCEGRLVDNSRRLSLRGASDEAISCGGFTACARLLRCARNDSRPGAGAGNIGRRSLRVCEERGRCRPARGWRRAWR